MFLHVWSCLYVSVDILWGPTTFKPQNLYFWGPRNEPPNTGAERGSMKDRCCTMWGHGSYLVNHLCKVQATWCACYFGWPLFQRICYFVASTTFSDPLLRFFVSGAVFGEPSVAGAVFGQPLVPFFVAEAGFGEPPVPFCRGRRGIWRTANVLFNGNVQVENKTLLMAIQGRGCKTTLFSHKQALQILHRQPPWSGLSNVLLS